MAAELMQSYPPLRLPDKLLATLTWICAAGIFATVGWMAISPRDPHGAVSLLTRDGWTMIPQIAALAAGVAAVVTAAIGRKLPDAGTFAVAVGLAVANLQGESATYVLTYVIGAEAGAGRAVYRGLAVEGVVWFAVLATCGLVSGVVMRWCYGRVEPGRCSPRPYLPAMSIADVPLLGRRLCGADIRDEQKTGVSGLLFTVVTAVLALLLIRVLSTGSPARAVQHGQVYFALAVSFFAGHWFAYRLFPVHTPLWGCLAVPVVCIIGYVWTSLQPQVSGAYAHIASVPPTVYARALPLDYISVGTAAVLVSFWSRPRPAQSCLETEP